MAKEFNERIDAVGGIKLPGGAAAGRLIVSDDTGNAVWTDPLVALPNITDAKVAPLAGINASKVAMSDSLRAVSARAKEPQRKVRVHNDVSNPRAVARTNWTSTSGFVFSPVFTDIDDADFAVLPNYGANGHCAQVTGTSQAGTNSSVSIYFAYTGTTGTVVCISGQEIYFRAKVKMAACPVNCTVQLDAVFDDTGGLNRTDTVIATRENVNAGDIFVLEGFMPATQVRAHGRVVMTNAKASPGVPYDMRVGQAHIVVEPDGDVPGYVDGYVQGAWWDGTADASTSFGYVWPVRHSATGFRGGHNSFQLFSTDVPADADQMCDYAVELNTTHMRMSMGGGPMGCDAAWPSGAANPDWTLPVLAAGKMAAACRKRGLKWLPIIGAPCTWMTTNGTNDPGALDPARTADFIRLQTSLISTYGDVIDSVEMYNEINLLSVSAFWNNPAGYVALSNQLYDAVKAVRPDITYVSGCLARITTTDATVGTSIYDYLTGMYNAGAKGKMDAVSFHPYTDALSTADPTASGGFHSGFDQCFRQARAARHNAGDDATPFWITEYGWATGNGGNDRSQMQAMALWRGIMGRSPDVQAAFFHTLVTSHDTPSGWQRTFSFLEVDSMRRRPVFNAFKRNGCGLAYDWWKLALLNSWTPYAAGGFSAFTLGTAGQFVAARKDANGNCELRGIVNKTTGVATDPICVLPDEFIPLANFVAPVAVYTGAAWQMGAMYILGRIGTVPGQVYINAGGSIAAGALNMLHANWVADE